MRRHQYGIIVGLCLILGACGGQASTGGQFPPTSTIVATPLTITPTTAATRVASPPPSQGTPTSTAAFTLFFDAGLCGIGTLDTAAGTFARKIESDQPARVIMLTLPAQDLAAIRQKVAAIGFFDYPENFAVTPASGSAGTMFAPSITYTIEVQLEGQRKRVVWNDDIRGATTPEAENLRVLIGTIENAIQSTPEYRGLPPRNFGCA